MSRRKQIAAMAAKGLPDGWRDGFAALGRGGKLTCLTCGQQGYADPGGAPSPWQWDCIAGHPDTCPGCGARLMALEEAVQPHDVPLSGDRVRGDAQWQATADLVAAQKHNDAVCAQLRADGLDAVAAKVAGMRPGARP